MCSADVLTLRECMMGEPFPLATRHQAVLAFLRGRDDVVVFGAQAVHAYVHEPRMTQDLALLAIHADVVAQELCAALRQRCHMAVCVRRVGAGRGLRVLQVRKAGNRHVVDLRAVETFPGAERIAGVLVLAPAAWIASKVTAYHQRRGQPKAGTDWRDLAMLFLTFPALKSDPGPVGERLHAAGATPEVLAAWQAVVAQAIRPPEEDEDFESTAAEAVVQKGGEVCTTSLPQPAPNKGVQATANSLRSCLAPAIGGA